jgi:hypothetical protein
VRKSLRAFSIFSIQPTFITMKNFFLMLLLATTFFTSCKKDEDDDNNHNHNTATCNDSTVIPLVMLHGTLASGDTYANTVMRFTSNDYCGSRLFVFDYNGANFGGTLDTAALDDFIDEVLQTTGVTQVNLAGHSLGGGFGYQYLSNAAHAAKVQRYVHIASDVQTQSAGLSGEVLTLNIYSADDEVVAGSDIPGATNMQLTGKDHYEVATCAEAFEAMYKFFNNNTAPATTQITTLSDNKISGKVLTLGENTPVTTATVKIFEVNASTGERLSSTPNHTPTIDDKGAWGPVTVTPNAYYEFEVTGPSGRSVHYYREGFKHNNPLVYLRTLPSPTSTLGSFLSSLPEDDNQSVMVVFTANQATIDTRDSLSVNDNILSNAQFCNADATTIAFFLYDDGDYTTELTPLGFFGSFPFLEAADLFVPTATPAPIKCRFNGRNLFMRNWKSDTEGVAIAVFD